ncbi:MAG: hypothetical protein HOP06_08560 [Methylotenera sp.]|nr:hypothetical protein [Methylotenera sp.]
MKNNHFTHQLATRLTTLAATLIFASAALAGAVDTPRPSGGGGVGIGIDIGSVINILKNANKKCDPKVLEEAQKTCAVKSSNPVATQAVVDQACVKKLCAAGGTTGTVIVEPKKEDNKCNPEVEEGAHYAYQHGVVKGMTEDAYVKKQCAAYAAGIGMTFKAQSVKRTYQPQGPTCKVNGNFETGGLTMWTGADNGLISPLDFIRTGGSTWTNIPYVGIKSNTAITNDNGHQTIVNAGVDPSVGALLQQLPPSGGSSAARVGNSQVMYGEELLAKSFMVTPADAIVNFSYALVLENPSGHPGLGLNGGAQPTFMVVVRDAAGNDITGGAGGRVHLSTGLNPNVMVADATQPFFTPFPTSNPTTVYKDWSCAQINLADLVGQNVTVEFITHDCGWSGHYGYAYIDDFCGTCGIKGNDGWLELAQSDKCGVGKVCVDVGVPHKGSTIGQATIKLDIWQSGVLVKTLTSPVQTANGQYCFTIDPATISGLDLTKGFDYNATATMQLGSITLPPKTIGVPITGTLAAQNNDYTPKCAEPCASCGTATTPLCPPCGQQGQPLCPACGQAGQPACPVQTGCTPNMLGCIDPPDEVCAPGSPGWPLCKHSPPTCLNPPCMVVKPPKVACIPKIKPMKELPTKAAVKPKAKPRPKPVVSKGDVPKPVHKVKRKPRPKPAQSSAPVEAPFDDGC